MPWFSRPRIRALVTYWPLTLAAAAYLAVAGWYLARTRGNVTFFVHFGAGHHLSVAFGGAAAGLWLHEGASDLGALGVSAVARALTRRGPDDAAAAVQTLFVAGLTASNLIWPAELTRKTIGLWLFSFLGFAQHRDRWTLGLLFGIAAATALLGPWLPPVA